MNLSNLKFIIRCYLIVFCFLCAFILNASAQVITTPALNPGGFTGSVWGQNFIQTGSTLDLAPGGTLTTTGINIAGGAINRSFSSITKLAVGQSLTVDLLHNPYPINSVSFGTYWDGDPNYVPAGFVIDYANSASGPWTTLATVTNNTYPNAVIQYPFYAVNIDAEFWRITVTAVQPGHTQAYISGFQIIATGIGAVANNYWNALVNNSTIYTNTPVSIGSTYVPSNYMLSVNGNVISTSMTVQSFGNWPDYVFKKDYRLPALSAVHDYVVKNHHLPDVPASEEIGKNGLNLGEMNKLLLKKVEELTLYMIEKDKKETLQSTNLEHQEKVSADQQRRIKSLEKQIKLLSEKLDRK